MGTPVQVCCGVATYSHGEGCFTPQMSTTARAELIQNQMPGASSECHVGARSQGFNPSSAAFPGTDRMESDAAGHAKVPIRDPVLVRGGLANQGIAPCPSVMLCVGCSVQDSAVSLGHLPSARLWKPVFYFLFLRV